MRPEQLQRQPSLVQSSRFWKKPENKPLQTWIYYHMLWELCTCMHLDTWCHAWLAKKGFQSIYSSLTLWKTAGLQNSKSNKKYLTCCTPEQNFKTEVFEWGIRAQYLVKSSPLLDITQIFSSGQTGYIHLRKLLQHHLPCPPFQNTFSWERNKTHM